MAAFYKQKESKIRPGVYKQIIDRGKTVNVDQTEEWVTYLQVINQELMIVKREFKTGKSQYFSVESQNDGNGNVRVPDLQSLNNGKGTIILTI